MTAFGNFRKNVRSRRSNAGAAIVAGHARYLIRTAQEPRLPGRIVRHMTSAAGVVSNCAIASNVRLIRSLVCGYRMSADRPVRQIVNLSVDKTAGIMAREAKLPPGIVANKKHWDRMVFALGVRIVARSALHGVPHEFDSRIFCDGGRAEKLGRDFR